MNTEKRVLQALLLIITLAFLVLITLSGCAKPRPELINFAQTETGKCADLVNQELLSQEAKFSLFRSYRKAWEIMETCRQGTVAEAERVAQSEYAIAFEKDIRVKVFPEYGVVCFSKVYLNEGIALSCVKYTDPVL